eukprot:3310670-Rhodomonas_salina.1
MRPLFFCDARPMNDEWNIRPYLGVFPLVLSARNSAFSAPAHRTHAHSSASTDQRSRFHAVDTRSTMWTSRRKKEEGRGKREGIPRICTVEAGYLARLVREPACEMRRAPTISPISADRFGATAALHTNTHKDVSLWFSQFVVSSLWLSVLHAAEVSACLSSTANVSTSECWTTPGPQHRQPTPSIASALVGESTCARRQACTVHSGVEVLAELSPVLLEVDDAVGKGLDVDHVDLRHVVAHRRLARLQDLLRQVLVVVEDFLQRDNTRAVSIGSRKQSIGRLVGEGYLQGVDALVGERGLDLDHLDQARVSVRRRGTSEEERGRRIGQRREERRE